MTATIVNGLPVIQDVGALSPISTRFKGSPIHWKQIRELTLSDGSTIFGCVHCDYTNTNRNSMRPHLNAHRGPRVSGPAATVVEAQERTIALLGKELDRAERKALKATSAEKAAKAEARRLKRELDTLRGILNPSLNG